MSRKSTSHSQRSPSMPSSTVDPWPRIHPKHKKTPLDQAGFFARRSLIFPQSAKRNSLIHPVPHGILHHNHTLVHHHLTPMGVNPQSHHCYPTIRKLEIDLSGVRKGYLRRAKRRRQRRRVVQDGRTLVNYNQSNDLSSLHRTTDVSPHAPRPKHAHSTQRA